MLFFLSQPGVSWPPAVPSANTAAPATINEAMRNIYFIMINVIVLIHYDNSEYHCLWYEGLVNLVVEIALRVDDVYLAG